MAISVNLEKNGMIRQAPVGFSWTTLFFGFLVPLFRGDWVWFIIMLLIGMLSLGVINFILCFLYNKIYVTKLIENGWVPADAYSAEILRSKGIIF